MYEQYCFGAAEIGTNKNARYYALADIGGLEYQDASGAWNDIGVGLQQPFYEEATKKGDTIKMVLNVSEKSLTFIKNGIDNGIAYKDIDTSKIYKMAVALQFVGEDTVELTKFNIRCN